LKEKLLERLEACLVNAVSDIGVDVNKAIKFEHHSQLLSFLPGFGLRKAESFKQRVQRMSISIENRETLLLQKLTGKIVWNNISGFLKISSKTNENPLENTRIHPECYLMYDFAPKICADALGLESNPSKYSEIVLKLMKSVRTDLEKRVKKFPEWLDKWANGKPEYYIDGADQHMHIGNSKITIELYDCLQNLLLDEYVQELEVRGKGKRRIQFEQIKEELRYPWLDLRKPLESVSPNELFDIIFGESQYSLYVGMKIGCMVQEVHDQTFEGKDENIRRRQRAVVKTDNGIRGFIGIFDISDEGKQSETNLTDKLPVGQHVVATVVGIAKDKFFVDLSIKPSVMERDEAWWLENRSIEPRAKRYWEQMNRDPSNLFDAYFKEKEALEIIRKHEEQQHTSLLLNKTNSVQGEKKDAYLKSGSSSATTRVIYHPLFANVDFKGAEEKLKSEKKGAGAVIIRPSSRGSNFLALTWAFQENWFKHFNIEEYGKRPGDLGLGPRLVIREENNTFEFSDLDELYKFFVEPLNDLVSAMTKHKNFRAVPTDAVEKEMKDQIKSQPNRIPYFIRFEPGKPGVFVLTWMSLSNRQAQVKTLKISITPGVSTNSVINFIF
jgi:transcription elongation factor SPT6